tara:strand:- start:4866 stop:6728 length:1863 start_codon:yes stop_codon:yes gene_type:complete
MYKSIISLPRYLKQLIVLLGDILIALISFYLAIALRLESLTSEMTIISFRVAYYFFISLPLIIFLSARITQIDMIILRSFGINDFYRLSGYTLVIAGFFSVFVFVDLFTVPRSIIIIFPFIFFLGICIFRLILFSILNSLRQKLNIQQTNIVIFGAGNSGIQLSNSLSSFSEYFVSAFIDDNPNLNNTTISNKIVFSRKKFKKFILKNKIDEIWMAIPSAPDNKKQDVLKFLASFDIKIRTLPSINELLKSGNIEDRLKQVNADDFIDRNKVDIPYQLFEKSYNSKNILVTGAGGSIGSELTKQLLNLKPKKLILLDHNEFALYSIEKFIREYDSNIDVIPCLGTIIDLSLIEKIMDDHKIEVVIHAAAYKHVPLVESNPIDGFKNNVVGTNNLVATCIKKKIDRFILVSTDKAVHSENIMGASKRISEIIVQEAAKQNKVTNFAIVRFGNVIGSSGSVIPLFREQIFRGGPVTVTDENMTRYFMSISEASQLVLLAGSYGSEGEIFILDMGKPIRIIDLAKNMIQVYGFTEKNQSNPDGDIEIHITKKRPGEKMEEELYSSSELKPTNHKKVNKAIEDYPENFDINYFLNEVAIIIKNRNTDKLYEILSSFKEFKIKKN